MINDIGPCHGPLIAVFRPDLARIVLEILPILYGNRSFLWNVTWLRGIFPTQFLINRRISALIAGHFQRWDGEMTGFMKTVSGITSYLAEVQKSHGPAPSCSSRQSASKNMLYILKKGQFDI